MPSHNNQKKIAVINDFCGFGRCSIAAELPIISAMQIQCCPLPTAIFSNHTGFSEYYWNDYTKHMPLYAQEWKKLNLRFDGITTGFLGSEHQIDIVTDFIKEFKDKDTVVVVDPVMGDYGKLYPTYSLSLANKMKELVEHADVLTPNLTEVCFLTDTEYDEYMPASKLLNMCKALSEKGPGKIVISGLDHGEHLSNFVYDKDKGSTIITKERTGPNRSGTGDVFAAILTADCVNGVDLKESVDKAASYIATTIARCVELGIPETDGICFEETLHMLIPKKSK